MNRLWHRSKSTIFLASSEKSVVDKRLVIIRFVLCLILIAKARKGLNRISLNFNFYFFKYFEIVFATSWKFGRWNFSLVVIYFLVYVIHDYLRLANANSWFVHMSHSRLLFSSFLNNVTFLHSSNNFIANSFCKSCLFFQLYAF